MNTFWSFLQKRENIVLSMLRFRTIDSKEPLFEAVYKVEKIIDQLSDVQILHPLDAKVSDETKKIILKLCFPLENNMCNHWDTDVSVFILEEKDKSYKYLYVQYFDNASKVVAISILSKFLHIRLFKKILFFLTDSNSVNILNDFSKAPFTASSYSIICSPPAPEYGCPYDVSQKSEIASLHQFFYKNYPPFYAAWIIVFLLSNLRIFVTSSSSSKITQTVLSILSLFYPLTSFCQVKSLIYHDNENEISQISGPCVIGIPSLLLPYTTKLITKNDVILNCDEPNLCCELQPKFNHSLYLKIQGFQSTITSATMHIQPGFPSSLIVQHHCDFIASYIVDTFGLTSKDYEQIANHASKVITSGGNNAENALANSKLLKELIEKTDKGDKEIQDLFWAAEKKKNDLHKAMELSSTATRGAAMPLSQGAQKRSKTFLGLFKN